ncbi:Maltose permease [Mycena indigotica]|uniref:Maltose permease n=1 Tax=Mycena indigotica TaxID=2126181 RepID=A0A8H6S0W9_9AGAR|nr:Maltose permease [Mycena indigotica]KAF7291275.1 Maltose permease [Mycena indigotica]
MPASERKARQLAIAVDSAGPALKLHSRWIAVLVRKRRRELCRPCATALYGFSKDVSFWQSGTTIRFRGPSPPRPAGGASDKSPHNRVMRRACSRPVLLKCRRGAVFPPWATMASLERDREDPAVGVLHTHAQLEIDNYAEVVKGAAANDEAEHKQTLREAFRIHKKAVFWSVVLSAALIMEGYDVVVIASFYEHPAFLNRFGIYDETAKRRLIPAPWQSGLGNGSSVGGIIGLMINGWASEKFGPRRTYIVSMLGMIVSIFGPVFSKTLGALVASEVICGLFWGVFQTLTTAYASEVCPIALRHYLTAYINMCWGIGIFLSSGVVRASITIESDWGWRLPFVIQWVWPVPLILGAYFAPESPWWLVRQGRHADAEKSVRRLTNHELYSEEDAKRSVANMIHTTAIEREMQAGTSYLQCFSGIDRRRTEIAMMVFAIQLLSGENLIGQGVQFFVQAGLGQTAAFDVNLALNSMFIIGTVASWFILARVGRRALYISGLAAMAVVLAIIGALGFHPSEGAKWASGGLLIALNFVYNATLGAGCYVIIAEVGSTRLRAKTIVLARCAYQVMNIICGIIVPRMLSPAAWNWGPKSGIFWFVFATLSAVYCWFRLPETANRSYGELDVLFENRVPAWRFKSAKVDQFDAAGSRSRDEKASESHEEAK